MAMKLVAPSQVRLKQVLHYDPLTGVFRWRNGRIAGTVNPEGYRRIQIGGLIYPASRLAWVYMTGEDPPNQVDHEDRDTGNDRWENLRLATQGQNKANSGVYRNNRLRIKGVRLHRNGQYEARIRVDGKLIYLGCRRTPEAAKAVYDEAAKRLFGEFASPG